MPGPPGDPWPSILGHSNSAHDNAIAVIADDFVFAEEIARHTQCKFSLNFPGLDYSWRAVRAALKTAGRELTHDVVLRTTWPDRPLQFETPSEIPEGYFREWFQASGIGDHARDLNERFLVEEFVQSVASFHRTSQLSYQNKRQIVVKTTQHHLTHAAGAVYTAPFEECVCVIADRMGESDWLTVYHYDGKEFRVLERAPAFSCSLGGLYTVVTQLCGFSAVDQEEWKTMGLAAYSERDPRIYEFFRSRMHVDGLVVRLDIQEYGEDWVDEIAALSGPFRKPGEPDIIARSGPLARSFQDCFEDVMTELIANAAKLGLSENLAYSGGLALNSSCNGKILRRSGFRRMHVPSAPGDDGNALGAALYEHFHERRVKYVPAIASPYLGSEIPEGDVERIARIGGMKHVRAADDEELCDRVSTLLADGKIVAWCQGRAEYGPRALGNRSILADPRRAEMKDIINERVKFREEFRPLAPSILHEHGPRFFDPYELSPYMERTLPFRDDVKDRVPAVVHRDGTGRLQSVMRELNPLYHRLIERFYEKTAVPILLNTSFNVMGKPIVHSASDAIAVFYTSGIDVLVLGRWIFLKA